MHDWEPDESEAGADPELESGAPAYDLGFGVADALAEANARADADAFNLRMAEHVAGRRYVKVGRDLDGESDVHGFLLAASPGWLLLHEVSDFHLNGFVALARSEVCDVRHGKFEQAFGHMLAAEGVVAAAGLSARYAGLRIGDSESLFTGLMEAGRPVIVEGERSGDDMFLIGEVRRVGRRSLSVLHFDANGRYDRLPTLCDYGRVTRVTFESEYIRVFSKYTKD